MNFTCWYKSDVKTTEVRQIITLILTRPCSACMEPHPQLCLCLITYSRASALRCDLFYLFALQHTYDDQFCREFCARIDSALSLTSYKSSRGPAIRLVVLIPLCCFVSRFSQLMFTSVTPRAGRFQGSIIRADNGCAIRNAIKQSGSTG